MSTNQNAVIRLHHIYDHIVKRCVISHIIHCSWLHSDCYSQRRTQEFEGGGGWEGGRLLFSSCKLGKSWCLTIKTMIRSEKSMKRGSRVSQGSPPYHVQRLGYSAILWPFHIKPRRFSKYYGLTMTFFGMLTVH